MSVRALTWAWQQTTKTPTQKLVLAALADRADDDGYCYPSCEWLAFKCAPVSEGTIRNVLTQLDEQGLLLKVERRRRGNGTLSTWLYRLPVDETSARPRAVDKQPTTARTRARRDDQVNLVSPDGDTPTARTRAVERPRDLIFEALAQGLGVPLDQVPRGRHARGAWNSAATSLKEEGATPEGILAACREWRDRHPDPKYHTPGAIAKHYPQLRSEIVPRSPADLRAEMYGGVA